MDGLLKSTNIFNRKDPEAMLNRFLFANPQAKERLSSIQWTKADAQEIKWMYLQPHMLGISGDTLDHFMKGMKEHEEYSFEIHPLTLEESVYVTTNNVILKSFHIFNMEHTEGDGFRFHSIVPIGNELQIDDDIYHSETKINPNSNWLVKAEIKSK